MKKQAILFIYIVVTGTFSAHASNSIYANAGGSINESRGDGPQSAVSQISNTYEYGGSSSAATGSIYYGSLSVGATAGATAWGVGSFTEASSYDVVRFYAPGLDNKIGIVNATLQVRGNSTIIYREGSGAQTGQTFDLRVFNGTKPDPSSLSIYTRHSSEYGVESTINGVPTVDISYKNYPLYLKFSFPMLFGQDNSMYLDAHVDSGVVTNFPDLAIASIGLDVIWMGIDSITVDGIRVAYSASSYSGFDWSNAAQPVPLPGALSAMVVGLTLIGLFGRTRKFSL